MQGVGVVEKKRQKGRSTPAGAGVDVQRGRGVLKAQREGPMGPVVRSHRPHGGGKGVVRTADLRGTGHRDPVVTANCRAPKNFAAAEHRVRQPGGKQPKGKKGGNRKGGRGCTIEPIGKICTPSPPKFG
eukprot:COSAG04_NODE_1463_length_6616_cov_16.965782_5_plen_129_part_00